MKTKSFIVLIICMFACALSVQAQEVHGVVSDPSGAVIEGAQVRLLMDGQLANETHTDGKGSYSLRTKQAVPGAEYSIRISAQDFSTLTKKLAFASKGQLEFSARLAIATSSQAVNVEGRSEAFRDQFDRSEMRDSTARDIGEALAGMDGISKIRKGGIANDLVIRGMQQNNINVQIDGERVFGACPGHMDPPSQHVDFAEVERVDVLKGPYDVANQGTLGALVNIVTKTPGLGFHIKPSVSAGSSGFFNPTVTVSNGTDRFKFLAGYSYRVSDPYQDGSGRSVTSYANYRQLGNRKGFDINSGWFETELTPGANQKFSLSYTRQVSGLVLYPYLTMDSDFDRADRGSFKYHATAIGRTLRAVRVETYVTRVQHYMSDRLRLTSNPATWKMASDAGTHAIGGRVEADIGRDITFGVESYWRNWDMLSFANMAMSITSMSSIPDVDTRTVGTYIDFRHAFMEKVKLSGGFRVDHATTQVDVANFNSDLYYLYRNTRSLHNQDNYPSGNVRINLGLAKGIELFVGVGSNARIPDAEERYFNRKTPMAVTVGNPLLPSTRNTQADAGFTLNLGRSYIKPSLFYSNLDNYIVVNKQPRQNMPSSGMMPATAGSYQNVNARIYGGEIGYAFGLPHSLTLSGGGSYSRGTVDRKPLFQMYSTTLPEMPPLRSWAALRYTHKIVFAELGGSATSRQTHVNSDLNETPTAGYGLLNTKIGVNHKNLYLSFVIDNLLNKYYYEHLSYHRDPDYAGVKVPEPGRNYFGQIRYNF